MPENMRLVGARTAHVMVGAGCAAMPIAHGINMETGKQDVAMLSPSDGSIGDRWSHPDCTLALCQWDDSRGFFVIGQSGEIYDEMTPMELEGRWKTSWRTVLHKMMQKWPLDSKSNIEIRLWANMKNLVSSAGMLAGMFYISAVAMDIDYARRSTKISTSKLFETMIEDYSYVDTLQSGLDIVQASTIKEYGPPELSDLRIQGRGDWRDWEDYLSAARLPSNTWLVWRRITSLIGEIPLYMASKSFVSFADFADMTESNDPDISTSADNALYVIREWMQATEESDAEESKRMSDVLVDFMELITWSQSDDEDNPWSGLDTTGREWNKRSREIVDTLSKATVRDRISLITGLWSDILGIVKNGSGDDDTESMTPVDDAIKSDAKLSDMMLAVTAPLNDDYNHANDDDEESPKSMDDASVMLETIESVTVPSSGADEGSSDNGSMKPADTEVRQDKTSGRMTSDVEKNPSSIPDIGNADSGSKPVESPSVGKTNGDDTSQSETSVKKPRSRRKQSTSTAETATDTTVQKEDKRKKTSSSKNQPEDDVSTTTQHAGLQKKKSISKPANTSTGKPANRTKTGSSDSTKSKTELRKPASKSDDEGFIDYSLDIMPMDDAVTDEK